MEITDSMNIADLYGKECRQKDLDRSFHGSTGARKEHEAPPYWYFNNSVPASCGHFA
jgi:hypothetical protein